MENRSKLVSGSLGRPIPIYSGKSSSVSREQFSNFRKKMSSSLSDPTSSTAILSTPKSPCVEISSEVSSYKPFLSYPITKKVVEKPDTDNNATATRKRKRDSHSLENTGRNLKIQNPKSHDKDLFATSEIEDPKELIVSILMKRGEPASPKTILHAIRADTDITWTQRYKSKFGNLIHFVRMYPETFAYSYDGEVDKISLHSHSMPTSVLDTLTPEPLHSSTEVEPQFIELVCVRADDGSYRGWKAELLVEEITDKVLAKFLLCCYCRGVLRDACLFEKDGKQEMACFLCIQKATNKQLARINRETINEKQVYCPLKSKGCGWTNELSEVLHHLEECELFPMACPLGCRDERGEVSRVERRRVETHRTRCPMRAVKCDHCNCQVKYSKMGAHLNICEDSYIVCPNACNESMKMKRKDMSIHLKRNCPLHKIECPFSLYGCKVRVERRYMSLHEKKEIHTHLKLSMLINIKTQRRVTKLELENDEFRANMFSLVPKRTLQWNISEIRNKILLDEDTYSDPFYVGLYKFQACLDWNRKENYVGVFLHIMKGECDDTLHWPLRYKYTAVLINQVDAKCNHEKSNVVSNELLEEMPDCFRKPQTKWNEGLFGCDEFISHTDILHAKYCNNDSITLNVSVEQLLDS